MLSAPRFSHSYRSPFPPIANYGFISDCHTSALIAPDGGVEWLCVPRFDAPSVFGAVLDRDAGSLRIAPAGFQAPLGRRYMPGTLILETTWTTDSGWLVVTDALTITEWALSGREERGMERPRPEHEADRTLVRYATCIDGEVEVELSCRPSFEYGAAPASWEEAGDGELKASGGSQSLNLATDINPVIDGETVKGSLTLREGQACFAAVCWDEEGGAPRSAPDAQERIVATSDFWRAWLLGGHFPDHPWRVHLQRSAVVLKGLTYAPTGSLIAAATTSLPETPGGERNWDYRYSWIRDSTFSLWALHTLGFDQEARSYADFIAARVSAQREEGRLQIMYGIGGERDLAERTLDHLSGYEGAKPVRIGNGAYSQRQNDVWGALLDSIYIHNKATDHIHDENWVLICHAVEAAIEAWPNPDQGIWEARGEPKHYVSSKLMIWVAVDRGARLAHRRGERERAERWGEVSIRIKDEILERGVRDDVFRQHYETDALDASTLLIPLVRFLPPTDDRLRKTVQAIAEDLTRDGLVLRYRVDDTDDGLHGEEATFTICSFWLASAYSEIGEREKARELCERLLGLAGPLDLYAEELDPRSGRHWGNFPQAFTHLALINAVSHVIADAQRDGAPGELTAVFSELRGMREEG
jgi:GH15 family glucan-1,4-alpha-glucosidase